MKKLLLLLSILILAGMAFAQDGLSLVNFLVVRDSDGKPIRNAAVVLHPVKKNGKQERGGLELKCDAEGKANFDGVPYGKLRIQVLAQGFQTYGEDFEIAEPAREIKIRMKRPVGQYSIYSDKNNDKKNDDAKSDGGDDKGDDKKDDAQPKDAKPQ
ncbi:MAG TPA: carboxypeptidase-like regulatory domain-containing protein [Terriglobales bacterium]|nr:carboxypeptidase-like regulatory domain-containing protein [Terriglobales bacterium]